MLRSLVGSEMCIRDSPMMLLRVWLVLMALELVHADSWAVLVDTSRFWFNYRHAGNTLAVYHGLKKLGMPDSNIVLMLADDMPCNPRNPLPAQVPIDERGTDVYGTDVEVDYRGEEVTVENFIRVLTGRHHAGTPVNKRLLSDQNSNVLVYMSGHGGEEFLKFQDSEEISAQDFEDAFQQMHHQRRYKQLLFITDTCQAATLNTALNAPKVLAIGSSRLGQNSYSYSNIPELGLSPLDRFSFLLNGYIQGLSRSSTASLAHMIQSLAREYNTQKAQIGVHLTTGMDPTKAKVVDFFGSAFQVSMPKHVRKIVPA
eukprot:TRINITY_DN26436_c0_g1_i1.p1 TRINITY_DN26436_c0_g1~~TRINITY_DN26436_c0_g1_i1.p1  ORF type:complete len:314 (-),score=74.63 TRINITY_DN26436_c0_g1_i1:222-1163(-)